VLEPFAHPLAQVMWLIGATGMAFFAWLMINRWMTSRQYIPDDKLRSSWPNASQDANVSFSQKSWIVVGDVRAILSSSTGTPKATFF
jgi:hypothetical protein